MIGILHKGLESSEALWRRNLRVDSLKLGEELHGRYSRRPEMDPARIAAGIIRPHEKAHFERVAYYGLMRSELPKSLRSGIMLAQLGPISAITNSNTSATYNKLCDAIYLASTGDEILLPAGCGANNGSFIRYSNYLQLNSSIAGYTNGSDAMVFGNPAHTTDPSLYTATYISIVGVPSHDNLTSVSWANTSGGQLTVVISGSPVTTYRRGMTVRLSGCTNTGTGGSGPSNLNPLSINNSFYVLSVSGGTLVLSAPASVGVYGIIGGSPVLNNDRAQISAPVGYLTAPLNPGDTTITLDDASDFDPNGARADFVTAWGNGDTTWQGVAVQYTGVSGNTLTGVSSSGLPSQVPTGNPIIAVPAGEKAILTPAATNATGNTLTALELWGASTAGSGPACAAIFQWIADPGTNQGSTTLTNVFVHDTNMGIRPGGASVGSGVFMELFDSEVFRGAIESDRNHNIYLDGDIFLFQNSISHKTSGVYLVKTRSRTNYILYPRTYSEWGSAANPFGFRGAHYDISNGGLTYFIGCVMAASEQDNGVLIRYQADAGYYPLGGLGANLPAAQGTLNPFSEIYVVNCDLLGPPNGTGYTGSSSFANNSPIIIAYPGMTQPEVAQLTTTSGGSLPARIYWACTTALDGSGNETNPSSMNGFDSVSIVTAKAAIGANSLAVLPSPGPRTGAVNYNVYLAHADPDMWWNSGSAIPPATGPNQFFYDSAFTLPVCVVNAGGSQPATFVYVGVTYVFSEGESVNFAVSGLDARFPGSSPAQVNAAVISVPANNLLTIKSPPSKSGATGWYPYVAVTSYNSGGAYSIGQIYISQQVFTPIAIGTDWVQSSAFISAATCQYNFYKQNASPIAIGTNWTEPTSGLTSHNPNLLKWLRTGTDDGSVSTLGTSVWFAVVQSGQAATNYVVNAYNNIRIGSYWSTTTSASIQVWSGAVTPFPFDADYPAATLATGSTSTTATTSAANTAILAFFRNSATAGSGWTIDGSSETLLMSEHKVVSSPQTGLAVTQTGGGSTNILVTALAQSTTLAQRGSSQSLSATTTNFSFTIPSLVVGDVVILCATMGNNGLIQTTELLTIDPPGPPALNQATAAAPIGSVINNGSAYYNPTGAGSGGGLGTGGWLQTYPGVVLYGSAGYPTVSSFNLQTNTFNGTSFAAPLVDAVWNGATTFDFTVASGSPLIGAGTNPGTGHSFSLVPTSQTAMIGTPTPGALQATMTNRTDGGITLGGIQATGAVTPQLRLQFSPWGRFGWDWKTVLTLGAAAIVSNPTVSRRRLLSLAPISKAPDDVT